MKRIRLVVLLVALVAIKAEAQSERTNSPAGIHLSPVHGLDYEKHLFQEPTLQSVTANTCEDGRALLELAPRTPIRTHSHTYPLEHANQALRDLKKDRIRGTAVLEMD